MASKQATRLGTALTALRGVIMVITGLFALFYPAEAVKFLVFVGGGVLLVDGILNLATLRLDGPRDTHFWVDALRSGFAILAGIAILLSPWLIPIFSLTFLLYFVGLQAIVVGIIEIVDLVLLGRNRRASLWPSIISAGAYALFGLALIVLPLSGAIVLIRVVAVLMIVYAATLFLQVWNLRAKSI